MTDKAEGNPAKKPGAEGVELITLANFLESVGPSSPRDVSDLWTYERPGASASIKAKLNTPDIRLHCDNADCGRVRTFRFSEGYSCCLPESSAAF